MATNKDIKKKYSRSLTVKDFDDYEYNVTCITDTNINEALNEARSDQFRKDTDERVQSVAAARAEGYKEGQKEIIGQLHRELGEILDSASAVSDFPLEDAVVALFRKYEAGEEKNVFYDVESVADIKDIIKNTVDILSDNSLINKMDGLNSDDLLLVKGVKSSGDVFKILDITKIDPEFIRKYLKQDKR